MLSFCRSTHLCLLLVLLCAVTFPTIAPTTLLATEPGGEKKILLIGHELDLSLIHI